MRNNYIVQYVDAHTGEVIDTDEFFDPGPTNNKGQFMGIKWYYSQEKKRWDVANAFGCGRPLDWWLKENKIPS